MVFSIVCDVLKISRVKFVFEFDHCADGTRKQPAYNRLKIMLMNFIIDKVKFIMNR